ncbi:DUF6307 family protein [Pseudonocardia sp. RS010]|uniref:DUF6307 family protein n=1 Tax=Pseudonocardia sp. RS010 TaxID=3385979 RepID=UPI0039A3C3C2
MTTTVTTTRPPVTPHERRVELVASAITDHSELDHDAAVALATHILQVLDHVPEHIR